MSTMLEAQIKALKNLLMSQRSEDGRLIFDESDYNVAYDQALEEQEEQEEPEEPEEPAPSQPYSGLRCSFCGKDQREVKKLIAGPTQYICDECVERCAEVLHRKE